MIPTFFKLYSFIYLEQTPYIRNINPYPTSQNRIWILVELRCNEILTITIVEPTKKKQICWCAQNKIFPHINYLFGINFFKLYFKFRTTKIKYWFRDMVLYSFESFTFIQTKKKLIKNVYFHTSLKPCIVSRNKNKIVSYYP